MNYEILTERLFLRPPTQDDCARLFYLMNDNSLTRFLTWEPHNDIEQTKCLIRSFIDQQNDDKGYHWCITINSTVVGLVSLIDVKRKIRTWTLNRAELSYWIGTDYQGNGYAIEASRAVLEFGFHNLGFHKIIVAHADKNIQSERICKKLGFIKYAHEHDAFFKNGWWHNLKWYEIIMDKNEME